MKNREIKFRAWCKKRWLRDNEWGLTPDGSTLIYDDECEEWNVQNKEHPWFDLKVCQFTGLHDKNGKEIYEGDIVKYYGYKIAVEYDSEHGQFHMGDYCTNGDCEVIGNIYENPELLRV